MCLHLYTPLPQWLILKSFFRECVQFLLFASSWPRALVGAVGVAITRPHFGTFREPEEGRQNLCLTGDCYGLRLAPFQALQLKPQHLLRWSWEEVAFECGTLWLERRFFRMGQENITLFSPLCVAPRKRRWYQPLRVSLLHTGSPTMCSYKVNTALSTPYECLYHTLGLLAPWSQIPYPQNWEKPLSSFEQSPPSIVICYGALHEDKDCGGQCFAQCQCESPAMTHYCALDWKLQGLFPRMLMAGGRLGCDLGFLIKLHLREDATGHY